MCDTTLKLSTIIVSSSFKRLIKYKRLKHNFLKFNFNEINVGRSISPKREATRLQIVILERMFLNILQFYANPCVFVE